MAVQVAIAIRPLVFTQVAATGVKYPTQQKPITHIGQELQVAVRNPELSTRNPRATP